MQIIKQQQFLLDGAGLARNDHRPTSVAVARVASVTPTHDITLCDNGDSFEALAAEWNELLSRAQHKSAFLKHQWMSAWWTLIGATSASRKLFVLLARDRDERLVGVLPLYCETRGRGALRRRVLNFLGSWPEAPEHLDAIIQDQGAASIVDALLTGLESLRNQYDAMELLDLAETSMLQPALARWSAAAGHAHRSWIWQECPYICLVGSFDKYMMTLTQKHRYKVRLFGKRLAAAHKVELEVAAEPAKVGRALEELFRLHAMRWTLKTDDVSGFDDPSVHAFHRRVAGQLAADDAIRIFLLCCDGRAVAACYCFFYSGRLYFFQPGFDPEFRKLHVGKVLLARVIEYCYQNGIHEFDFLRGTEDYKFDWTERKRSTIACNVALTPWSKVVHAFQDALRLLHVQRMALRRRVVTHLKSTPAGAQALAVAKRLLGRHASAPADE